MKLSLALATTALVALGTFAAPTFAQHKHGATAPATQSAAKELADGEIRRIDPAQGTVLLRHGEIKAIGMGPMTMGFKFKDPAMAANLKVGDRVRFAVEQQGELLVITQIQKVN